MTDTFHPRPELRTLTARPPLSLYLRELADRREYLREVPKADLRAQKLDTVLGNLWFLLNPLFQTGVYLLIFGLLLNVDRGVDNYPVYLVTGIMVFRFFSQTTTSGARVVQRNQTLMRSLYFPRAVVPMASAIGSFYMFLPGIAVMLVVVVGTGEWPTWRWILLPAVLAVVFGFVAGCSLFTARLGHIFPDLHQILPHVIRLMFYTSGALYDPDAFTSNDAALAFFDANPVFQLLSLMRWVLMGQDMPAWFWITAPSYAVVTLVCGFVYFWRGELTYGSER